MRRSWRREIDVCWSGGGGGFDKVRIGRPECRPGVMDVYEVTS